jgi:hypothetical protein
LRAGDRIRTGDVQLGKLAIDGASTNPINTLGEAAPDVAPCVAQLPTDPDLVRVVTAWETLPSHIRAAVLALVQCGGG